MRMQIGEVAERTGLSLRTIRHYEEVGLVVPGSRSPGGFRLYVQADVERLELIKQMKPLGFQLEEMRELLTLLDTTAAERDTEVLERFRGTAEQRCDKLRRQLTAGEGFVRMLGEAIAET